MNRFNIKLSRRHFIKLSGSAGLALLLKPRFGLAEANTQPNRRLVLLEMNGGCDGLNTVIPYANGTYHDLRPKLAIPADSVNPIDNQLGFHPALKQLHARFQQGQVAILQGIGHAAPDLSHFAMMDYWRSGHPGGAAATGQTGWLGRVLDALNIPEGVLSGLSLSNGVGPALIGQSATIATLTDVEQPYIPEPYQDLFWSLMNGLAAANSADSKLRATAKKGMRNSRLALDLQPYLAAGSVSYADNETGRLFDLAARILAHAPDVRVLHIPLPLDFDTHSGQAVTLSENFTELDGALGSFLQDLADRNLAEHTVVLMVSEFGRRADENNSKGTDHGTASNAFVIGDPVAGGLYGQQPSLTDLDSNGNLKMSLSYLDLLATITEAWMGVSAEQVLPAGRMLSLLR